MKRIISFLCTAAILTGCSTTPRVIVDVVEQLPSQTAEKVMVYDTDKNVPSGALPIGKVNVMEGGMTPADQCLYSNMLSLAVKKTAECGGNALHIDEHKKVSFPSSCHRIWGTMYLMPDSLVSGDAPSALSLLEEKKDQELLELANKQIEKRDQMFDNPENILKINIGPSWMTSEVQIPGKTYKNETGVALDVTYQHLWRSGLGLGINYMYHSTSFERNFNIKMHYIGPSLVYSIKLSNITRMDAALGLGYSLCREETNMSGFSIISDNASEESGVGALGQIGIECMVSKRVGIGLQLNAYTMRLKRPSGIDTSKYDFYGIRHLDALLGLRFYL